MEMNYNFQKGFTLIELMIVVAIITIISAIAIPAYSDYVTRSKRADAKTTLITVQLAQEKYRTSNIDYATLSDLGLSDPIPSPDGYYTVTVTAASTATYTLEATPTADQIDPVCAKFILSQTASGIVESVTGSANATPDTCWKR